MNYKDMYIKLFTATADAIEPPQEAQRTTEMMFALTEESELTLHKGGEEAQADDQDEEKT